MKFQVENVNCQNCVNLIKNSLENKFGEIKITLEKPAILELDLKEFSKQDLANDLENLGFKLLD